MGEQLEKVMCFVSLPNGLPKESLPSIARENLDATDICNELGVRSFIVHINIANKLWQEDIKFAEYIKMGTLTLPNQVDSLEGYNLLLRSWKAPTPFVLRAIESLGGRNELSLDDYYKAIGWPAYASQDYTHREIGMMPLSEVADSAAKYAIDGRVFAKTAEKLDYGHGTVTALETAMGMSINGVPYIRDRDKKEYTKKVDPETQIILSQPLSFETDAKGNREYRAWVFDNKVVALVRYGHPDDPEVPSEVSDFCKGFTEAHTGKLPAHYVADVGIANGLGPVVVEVNDIMYAGNMSKGIFKRILEAYRG